LKEIAICVGSSCHLQGSEKIVNIFKKLINDYQLEAKIILKGSFCQGNCTESVNISIAGKQISGVTPDNAKEIFNEYLTEGDI